MRPGVVEPLLTTNALPQTLLSISRVFKRPFSNTTASSEPVPPPILGAVIVELKLTAPLTEKRLDGELVPMPTLLFVESTNNKLVAALPLPATLKLMPEPGLLIMVSDASRSILATLLRYILLRSIFVLSTVTTVKLPEAAVPDPIVVPSIKPPSISTLLILTSPVPLALRVMSPLAASVMVIYELSVPELVLRVRSPVPLVVIVALALLSPTLNVSASTLTSPVPLGASVILVSFPVVLIVEPSILI